MCNCPTTTERSVNMDKLVLVALGFSISVVLWCLATELAELVKRVAYVKAQNGAVCIHKLRADTSRSLCKDFDEWWAKKDIEGSLRPKLAKLLVDRGLVYKLSGPSLEVALVRNIDQLKAMAFSVLCYIATEQQEKEIVDGIPWLLGLRSDAERQIRWRRDRVERDSEELLMVDFDVDQMERDILRR